MLYGSVTILNVHNLQKSYADRILFKNLSFGIDAGEKVGLIGPNGVGKSTLFQILIGRISADHGDAVFSKGVRLGFLEQEPRFASGSTILDTVLEKTKDKADALGSAYSLISQLGLDQFGENFKVDELSGGWKKRAALARELILEPDLLLLDEPTNHLDVSGILWLEKFLSSQRMAVMMITHDRLFLQRVCQRILDLDPRNPDFLLDVKGSYLEFTESKEAILLGQQAREEVLKNKLRREKEWLSRGPQARQTKQKARIQEAMELIDTVDEVKNRNLNRSANIDFGATKRLPKKLIHAEGITKSFGNQTLFKNLDLLIRPTTRMGLLGENGSGKSTLIKCLLGLEEPDQGKIEHAEDQQVSYFEQSKETLDLSKTVLENVCPEGDFVSFQGEFIHARSYLERFLFFGHHAGLVTSKLSGGERARLRLAQLMLKEAQVLVLDEPTNDLDTQTLDVLEEALRSFYGAVILVTHDRYFMDSVCTELLAFPKEKGRGELVRFADYFQWEEWFKSSGAESSTKKIASGSNEASASDDGESNATKKAKTRMSYKDKFELENIEKTIADLESALSDAEQAGDYTLMAKLQDEIDLKFKRWAELEQMSQG